MCSCAGSFDQAGDSLTQHCKVHGFWYVIGGTRHKGAINPGFIVQRRNDQDWGMRALWQDLPCACRP